MSDSHNLSKLPANLPVPVDDGACNHLTGIQLPEISLLSTEGTSVNLAQASGVTVIYCYPRIGRPDEDIPEEWSVIPGARGCTLQSCAFRDHYQELRQVGATQVFGLSAQTRAYQQEAANQLHLPFALLSDADLAFAHALRLPTFEFSGMTLIKRLTLISLNGCIVKVFYPVFPPDLNAAQVVEWLTQYPQHA